jgi:hypothetical protein
MLNSTYAYYNGVGNSSPSAGLPLQTIPKYRKNPAWEKECMDRLEEIGVSQVAENSEFRDYYRMVEGRVVHADYQPVPEITRDIVELRNEIDLPSYIKHFDLMGIIMNQIIGEYDNHQDKIRIDSLDEFAKNEYSRSKNDQLQKYIQESFDVEIKSALARDGFPVDKTDFKSKEEQQEYMKALEKKKAEIIPPSERQRQLNKSFKVRIVEWAEHVWEADRKKFSLGLLEKEELKDYLLTGRYFRHYKLGYDSYQPEHWRVEETFFSQDLDIKYPQDGEYVGRVFRLSAADIIQKYGHLLTHNQQIALTKTFSSSREGDEKYDLTNPNKRPVKEVREPLGMQTLDLTEQFQDALQQPLGEASYVDETGENKSVPYWMEGYKDGNGFLANNASVGLREDINVRTDTYQVTEGYWRGFQLVGFLYYEDERGIPDMTMVTEELLSEFIKENNIKKLKTTTVEEFAKDPKLNSIAYTYIPMIYQGKKIKGVKDGKEKDIYFDIHELPFQLKGDNNLYDLKLPVAGIIGNSFARKIRPYQFGYNVAMNQITNLLEKEIGMFFLMDINFLPSEFKDMGDSKEMLTELRDMAKEIGFMPVDFSKKNIEGASASNAGFQSQNISYAAEVQYRMQLADRYKTLALEQIGITPQRMGTPTGGETAEGIRQGVTASYAQTDNIYAPFNEANRKSAELHLTVAQHSEKSGKDVSVFFRKDAGDIATMKFSDEKFHLRQLGVTPVSDSKTRKNIEQLRNVLLNNNTMGSDMLEYAELFTADSMVELISIGRRSRTEKQKLEQGEHERQLELLDKQAQNEAAKEKAVAEREEASKERDRETDIEEANIRAVGAAVDNNAEAGQLDNLIKILDQGIKKENSQQEHSLKEEELSHKKEMDKKSLRLQEQDMTLKMKELKTKIEEIKAKERISIRNKN